MTIVDGNWGDKVDTRDYNIASGSVYGYGRPQYSVNGHTAIVSWYSNDVYHWKKCENCSSIISKSNHSFVVDVLTGESSCSTCGYGQRVSVKKVSSIQISSE